jgi:hypothetical protein
MTCQKCKSKTRGRQSKDSLCKACRKAAKEAARAAKAAAKPAEAAPEADTGGNATGFRPPPTSPILEAPEA